MGVSRTQTNHPSVDQPSPAPDPPWNTSSGHCDGSECSAGTRRSYLATGNHDKGHYMPATAQLINTNGVNFETSMLIFLLLVSVCLLLAYCVTARYILLQCFYQ